MTSKTLKIAAVLILIWLSVMSWLMYENIRYDNEQTTAINQLIQQIR